MDHNKAAAIKVLEEASEVRAAWQRLDLAYARANDDKDYMPALRTELADEIADVIQAACNLAARYNLNVADAMTRCEERNRARGRYHDGKIPSVADEMSPGAKKILDRMVRAAYE
jgi:NTP pyrophosphatase (non-canonical NTP hydrolase)